MEPMKLKPNKEGICFCPQCGGRLTFIKYMPAEVINGSVCMEDQEEHYECGACDLAFRKIVKTEFYQAYERKVKKSMEPLRIDKDKAGNERCPRCQSKLVYIGYSPVQIRKGRLSMEDSEPHYECGCCNLLFRRIVSTDFYQCYERNFEVNSEPQQLKPDLDGHAKCPRCQEEMRFVNYESVRIVDGRVNLEKTEPYYECDHCHLTYRRIVHTDFYQANKKKKQD